MNTRYKIFSKGCLDVIPLLIPVVPFGIIFGVIGIESGLGSTVTFLMSIIIFAGSSQLAFVQLYTGGATTPVIVSSVAIVNSRHFLYSAVIAQYLTKVKLFWKIILSYFLTDQAFIVSQKYFTQQPTNKDRHYHLLGSGFTLWFVWQLSTIAGIVLGEFIPKELNLSKETIEALGKHLSESIGNTQNVINNTTNNSSKSSGGDPVHNARTQYNRTGINYPAMPYTPY